MEIEKIPIKQHTIEICEYFDLNPYQLMSTGAMLIASDQGTGTGKRTADKWNSGSSDWTDIRLQREIDLPAGKGSKFGDYEER